MISNTLSRIIDPEGNSLLDDYFIAVSFYVLFVQNIPSLTTFFVSCSAVHRNYSLGVLFSLSDRPIYFLYFARFLLLLMVSSLDRRSSLKNFPWHLRIMLFLLFLLYSTLLHRLLYRVEVSNKTEGYILIKWKHYWIKCNNKWAWNDLPWMPGFWRIGTTKLHLRCLSYWRWAFMGVFREKWFGASFSKKLILTLDFKWFYSEYHNPLRNK